MKAKLITNPYVVYAAIFLFVLILYPLRWSLLYPGLSFGLVAFFAVTILISAVTGLFFHKTNYFSYSPVSYSSRSLGIVSIAIFLAYIPEYMYMHVIPVYAISTGVDYDYTTFGIPTFHVVLVTFNSFWATFVFHNIISRKDKRLVTAYILCLLPSIIIFNRGMFLIILANSLFVLLMSTGNMLRFMLRVGLLLFVILFLFGIAGNIRIAGDVTASDTILGLGGATESFEKSIIPNEFFWAYLYITSPMANLQETINIHHIFSLSWERLPFFINTEILPDFIAKRNEQLYLHIEAINQVSPSFNVGTVYARSFAYFGWAGMIIMFIYLFFFNLIVVISLSKRSVFFVSGIAILNSIMVFNMFDNMFTFAGTVLQLVFPILFGIFYKIKFIGQAKGKQLTMASNATA